MGFQDRDYYREQSSPGGYQLGGSRMMVTNLVIINAAIFLIDAFTPIVDANALDVNARWLDSLMSLNANVIYQPWKIYELMTYGFAHAPLGSSSGFFHVGMNMFMLWMFGRDIELRYGRRAFLRFYLAAILFAGVVWLGVQCITTRFDYELLSRRAMLGASGGVTAVLILYVLNYPRRTLYLWGLVAIPAWVAGVAWIGLDLLGAFGGRATVAYEAHLAGAGLAFAYHRLGWNFGKWTPRGISGLTTWLRARPELRVHDPEDYHLQQDSEADRILEKVHREGQDSLSSRERRILEEYSRRMRERRGQP